MISDNVSELNKRGRYLSVPAGISMEPLFHNKKNVVEVAVPTEPVRKRDMVLYIREDGTSVIHRVVGIKEGGYVIRGDNCFSDEFVPADQIAGVCTRFYRNGRWIQTSDPLYRMYSFVWCASYPVRKLAKRTQNKIIRLVHC